MGVVNGAVKVNIGGTVYEYNRVFIAFYLSNPLGVGACALLRRTVGYMVFIIRGDCIDGDRKGRVGVDSPFALYNYVASYVQPTNLSYIGDIDLVNSQLDITYPFYYIVLDRLTSSQRVELMVYDSRFGYWYTVAYAFGPTVFMFYNEGEPAVKISVYPWYSTAQKARILKSDAVPLSTAAFCLSPDGYSCIPATVRTIRIRDVDLTGITL
ncbi:MAG: hypothetical protein QXT00_09195 [Ignisphaera sp.]